jgi:hypothetical protein
LHLLKRSLQAFFEISVGAIANYGIWLSTFGGAITYSILIGNGLFGGYRKTPPAASEAMTFNSDQKLTSLCMIFGIFGLLAQSSIGTPLPDTKLLPQAWRHVAELQRIQAPKASVFIYPENHPVVAIGTF